VKAGKQGLAATLGIDPAQIRSFSNRDTVATDPAGQPFFPPDAVPGANWLYRPAASQAEAVEMCADDPSCHVLSLEGAAAAAASDPDARVIVLDEFDAGATSLQDIDEALTQQRTDLDLSTVHVVDGAAYQNFGPDQIVMYVTVANLDDVDEVCAKIDPCPTPVKLEQRTD
jgi:hypothetical protein